MKTYQMIDIAAILAVVGFCVYAGVFSLGPDSSIAQPQVPSEPVSAVSADLAPVEEPPLPSPLSTFSSWQPSEIESFADSSQRVYSSDVDSSAAPSSSARTLAAVPTPDSLVSSSGSLGASSSASTSASSISSSGSSSAAAAASASSASAAPSSPAPSSSKPSAAGNGAGTPPAPQPVQWDWSNQPMRNIADVFNAAQEVAKDKKLLPLSEAIQNLSKYDAFWYAQAIADNHSLAWRYWRENYPERLALLYVSPFTVAVNSHWSGLDLDYIEKNHPEWFLLQNQASTEYKNPDARIRWDPRHPKTYNYNRFFLDIGNPEFRRWAVNEFINKLEKTKQSGSGGYSGLAVDNVLLDDWVQLQTKRYPNWKYAGKTEQWTEYFLQYLEELQKALKSQGYLLIANHTADYSSNAERNVFQKLMEVSDGLVDEGCLMSSEGRLWDGTQWEWSLKNHEEILKRGIYDWWIFIPTTENPELEKDQFYYTFCSFLLIKDEQFSLFGTIRRQDGRTLDPWYEEYNLPLGSPVGPRYLKDGCWVRTYTNGTVVVNPTSVSRTFYIEGDSYALNWRTKEKVLQVTLRPSSAVILLPTPYHK